MNLSLMQEDYCGEQFAPRPCEFPLERAKASLKRKGWSYRRASTFLGYSFGHFGRVMSGDRESFTLFARIEDLPNSPIKYRASGFALVQRSGKGEAAASPLHRRKEGKLQP